MKTPATQKTQETWVQFLGWEDLPEEEMIALSSVLAWKILWTEEPGGLYSPWVLHCFPEFSDSTCEVETPSLMVTVCTACAYSGLRCLLLFSIYFNVSSFFLSTGFCFSLMRQHSCTCHYGLNPFCFLLLFSNSDVKTRVM